MAEPELIPSLPFDIALNCLLRVPLHYHSSLAQVCHSWRSLASSPSFLHTRHSLGYTDHYACLIQASHAPSSSGKTPFYGISIYDSKRHSWHRLPPIADFPDGLPLFCQCATVGCKLVLLGGWNPSSCAVLRSVYVYDFSTGLWKRGSSMPSSRSFFACSAIDGSVVVAGGHDDLKNALRTAEMYNMEKDEWEALPDMNEERDECKAVVMGGKLVVVSGFSTELQGQFG
ncbi:hypothetical protein L7F22_028525 [Adiantum nelumboides]|nr:hypothetical protein [Adiantum nelumboides]